MIANILASSSGIRYIFPDHQLPHRGNAEAQACMFFPKSYAPNIVNVELQVDFIIQFMEEVDKEISEMKLFVCFPPPSSSMHTTNNDAAECPGKIRCRVIPNTSKPPISTPVLLVRGTLRILSLTPYSSSTKIGHRNCVSLLWEGTHVWLGQAQMHYSLALRMNYDISDPTQFPCHHNLLPCSRHAGVMLVGSLDGLTSDL